MPSRQVPKFWQGFDVHSLMSGKKTKFFKKILKLLFCAPPFLYIKYGVYMCIGWDQIMYFVYSNAFYCLFVLVHQHL